MQNAIQENIWHLNEYSTALNTMVNIYVRVPLNLPINNYQERETYAVTESPQFLPVCRRGIP